jgi:tetratricopeptide (TPR) repeat protein
MYKKINKLDPARLDIYEKLAELYVKQQLWMEAKSNYQVLADYLLKQDNLGGTIGIYQKMVGIEPQNLQLHVKLADLFTQAKRIPEALREYGVVAGALAERGAHEESIRVYEKALKLAPDNVEILRTLVPLLLSINSVDSARAVLRKGLEASPRSVPLFLLAADAALAANDMAEARSFSDKARAVEPDNEDVLAAAVKIQLKGRRPDLAWAAAAPLADAAVRRGEAKKALGILVPIARAAPDVDELVKKIVDIASGTGDEATALPFRSALAELYRKKGKLAEAADLLRHCSSIQPDNAEFRSRLAQLEPHAGVVSVAPPRVPAPAMERQMEVTLSGFEAPPARVAIQPAVTAAPPPTIVREAAPVPDEFEFDLDDAEVIEAPGEMLPAEAPPATPPRGFAAPPPTPARGIVDPREAVQELGQSDEIEPAWGSLSAREALEAYEERQAEALRAAIPPTPFRGEEIEDLPPAAELPPEPVQAPAVAEFPDLELSLEPPEGFGPAAAITPQSFPVPQLEPGGLPEVTWPSAMFPEPEPPLEAGTDGPLSFGSLPRPASGDSALDDALVEADVFRRYGLVEKAVDQLRPWLERAPENLRIREKLFEIFLEQGQREEAREQAEILAEAYGVSGREDRIRGLEGLLGEPLRAAPPGEAEIPIALVEPAAQELVVDTGQAGVGTAEPVIAATAEPLEEGTGEPAGEVVAAYAEEPGREQTLPEAEGGPIEPPSPAEVPRAVLQALDEPQTDVISAVIERVAVPPIEPETAPEAQGAVLPEPEPELVPELASPADSERVPAPAVLEDQAPAPIVEPAAPVIPEARVKARPRLSAEDVLGLGKGTAAPAAKKVKTVRPEDVELDLLGARGPKPKPKLPTRVETVLPDDLLRSIRKPAPVPTPAPAPAPVPEPAVIPEPEAFPALSAEPWQAEIASIESSEALLAGEAGGPGIGPDLVSEEAADAALQVSLPLPPQPTPEELSELDFCLDQGMVVDAAERLQSLEGRFPGDPELAARRVRLEGGRGGAEAPRTALHDILSDDLDSVLDAELGRALTEDMVRESPAPGPPPQAMGTEAPLLDESGLFSDEQEFFNFADELHTELRRDVENVSAEEGREVSLEEIFRDFKKGVEQQLSPEDFETHYNLGIAYKEMGLTDEAIGEFQLAAKDPLHAVECCAMLGLCFLEKGLPQLAVKWYRKGLETIGIKEEDRLGIQYALAGVQEQIGDREGAYRTYLDIFGASAVYRDVPDRLKELKPFAAS